MLIISLKDLVRDAEGSKHYNDVMSLIKDSDEYENTNRIYIDFGHKEQEEYYSSMNRIREMNYICII